MKLFLPLKKATILVPSGPVHDKDRKHLFVILANHPTSDTHESSVLLVSVSSIKPEIPYDNACILNPGDHPFIKHNSFVVYARARIENTNAILRGVNDGKLIPQEPMSQPVFDRICAGLTVSIHTPRNIRDFFSRYITSTL